MEEEQGQDRRLGLKWAQFPVSFLCCCSTFRLLDRGRDSSPGFLHIFLSCLIESISVLEDSELGVISPQHFQPWILMSWHIFYTHPISRRHDYYSLIFYSKSVISQKIWLMFFFSRWVTEEDFQIDLKVYHSNWLLSSKPAYFPISWSLEAVYVIRYGYYHPLVCIPIHLLKAFSK